jgi:hypothetical protein
LSTVGLVTEERSRRSPEEIIARVHVASSSGSIPRHTIAMSSAEAW